MYAVRRVGESITASAATVIVALLTLLFASFGLYHDLGLPLAIGIAVMLVAGLTLLPALLAIFGRAVFWPTKTAPQERGEGVWGKVAARLVTHPVRTLVVGVLVLGAFAAFALGFKPSGFGGDVAAPAGSSAAKGNASPDDLLPSGQRQPDEHRDALPDVGLGGPPPAPGGLGRPTPDGVVHDPDRAARPQRGLADPGRTDGDLRRAPPVRVRPGADHPAPRSPDGVSTAAFDTYLTTSRYISADGHTVQWEAGLSAGTPGSTAAINAVPEIRNQVAAVAQEAGADAYGLAGEAPALYDVSHISDSDVTKIVPIAILAIGLVLALVLRSLIAPLYLILSVVLSYLASLGLSVLVFMKLGGQTGIVFLLPFLMFIFLLALGEDYNILVMTRIREEAKKDTLRRAVVRAVGATGPDRDLGRARARRHLRGAGRRRRLRPGQL